MRNLHKLKVVITELRLTQSLGSFQGYCSPINRFIAEIELQNIRAKDALGYQICSRLGQHHTLPKLYSPPLSDSSDGNSTTSPGRLFYCLLNLTHYGSFLMKHFFFFSSVHSLPLDNPLKTTFTIPLLLRGLYLQLSTNGYQDLPRTHVYALLSSSANLHTCNSFNLSSYIKTSSCLIILAPLISSEFEGGLWFPSQAFLMSAVSLLLDHMPDFCMPIAIHQQK